jgi:hypothetical protein
MNEYSKERKLSVTEKERGDKSSRDKRRIVVSSGRTVSYRCMLE